MGTDPGMTFLFNIYSTSFEELFMFQEYTHTHMYIYKSCNKTIYIALQNVDVKIGRKVTQKQLV